MILSASVPRTAIHVIPVARKSWNVIAFRVASLVKSSARSTPAQRRHERSFAESFPGGGTLITTPRPLRHYARALRLVQQYETKAHLTSDERDDADAVVIDLKKLVAPLHLNVSVVGARVLVDGDAVGTSPLTGPVIVSIGARVVRVTKPGFVAYQRTVTVRDTNDVSLDVDLAREVHEGRIVIVAQPGDTIRLDHDFVAMGRLEARVAAGPHRLSVTARGMRKQDSDVFVAENATRSLTVTLEKEKGRGLPLWAWLTGGGVLAVGLAVGAYFIVTAATAGSPFQPTSGRLGSIGLTGFRFQ